ncbi:uncharacterized protein LOC116025905 isoform X2 [Ipomoea triloba]|uniref:uncharacterized protein LOC116025905 isoform X2 n=1 Tax=Ipomoea triloba TaxID=35885 RepID=UPI00125E680C|nr:uncharacterized protein LOC116025905 isoform X2 [Ipomoea triloba]
MAGGVGEDTQNMLHLREESTIKKKKKMARVDANCNGLRLSKFKRIHFEVQRIIGFKYVKHLHYSNVFRRMDSFICFRWTFILVTAGNGSELVGITTRKQSQWCLSKYVLNVTVSRFRLMK